MRVLIITKIFPNGKDPLSSPFNRQQFSALAKYADVHVMATIPWFPGAGLFARWSTAGRSRDVPAHERIGPLEVTHPRYLYLPKSGYAFDGGLYAASLAPAVLRHGKVDVILGAWGYPDGVGAVLLGRALKVPVVVKVHGSDIDVIATKLGPKANLKLFLPRAARVVAVSRSLRDKVEQLGMPADRIDVIRNGVDDRLFYARDQAAARATLGRSGDRRKHIVYVGRLDPAKGVGELAAAAATVLAKVPDACLVFVGKGPARESLEKATAAFGDRVQLVGARPHDEIALWMSAADVVCLPSHHEGTPNVVLEALACGTPVVATRVGGIPDIFAEGAAGALVPPHDAAALADALVATLAKGRPADVGYRPSSWDESARQLHRSLTLALAGTAVAV